MEPQIRYARGSDGKNIAFWTLGDGSPPLLITPPLTWSHIALEWQWPQLRDWYERLAQHRMIIRYDTRGMGLSDRDLDDATLPVLCRDFEAVLGELGLSQVAMLTALGAWPLGVAYAASAPSRLSHLIIGLPEGDFQPVLTPIDQAMEALARADWATFTETSAYQRVGMQPGPAARAYADFMRQAIHPDIVMLAHRTIESGAWDAAPMLPDVRCPVLVIGHATNNPQARTLSASIAASRLVLVHDEFPEYALLGDSATRAINEFLGVPAERAAEVRRTTVKSAAPGMAVVLFTDIVDSTAVTERMGDAAFRAASRALDERIRAAIRGADGLPVEGKLLGDGVMAVFGSASGAIEAAQRCVELSADTELRLHVGLHAGDVIREKDNVYGGAVNMAARVCGLSAPGEILVSATVRDLARTSAGVAFEDRGEREMKGVADPVRVYAVRAEPA